MGVDELYGRRFREPAYAPTADRFVRHLAEKWGAKEVVVLGERSLSYLGLETESRRLARALLASGVGPGSRVALLAPNGPEWVVAKPDATLSADDLRAELAAYKVPRYVAVFAEQGDLPWLESGKTDLQALRRLLADRFSP